MPARRVSHKQRANAQSARPQSRQGATPAVNNLDDASVAASNSHGHGHGHGHGGGYGHHSGYGHHAQFVYAKEEEECDDSINPILALGTLAVLAAAAGLIFITLTQGRRKKRDLRSGEEEQTYLEMVSDLVWSGRSLKEPFTDWKSV